MATARARRTHRIAVGALGAVLAALTAACGAGTVTVATASGPGADREAPAPDAPTARPPDPLAPSTYRQAVRRGAPARPSVRAIGNAGNLHSVRYTDGVTVRVDRVRQGVEEGNGPGIYPGRPHTALTLTVVNHSARALALDQVVVTALYGSPARLAPPVYEDPAAGDFSGTLAPRASATATYVFSVPVNALRSVVAIVDIDGVHVAARLKGAM